MAPISKLFSFLFLTTLSLSLQTNARDSQFFSKVTPINKSNVRETEVPKNEGPVNKPEQQEQPVFIPETENSYGLYGHESGLHPPTTTTTNADSYTTTTTYQPYKTTSEEDNTNKYPNNNNYYNYQKDAYSTNTKYQNEFSDTRLTSNNNNNNNYYYNNNNKDAYGNKQNELSETKYTEGGYNSMANQNDNNNNKYYYNNVNNAAKDRYNFNNNNVVNDRYSFKNKAANNNNYNGERQGLSDTRFMEGGKYFYDVNSEKYNPSSRGVNSENWYNNRGYFGNNNVNAYENKNSMEGYQNQEEFEDDQDEFEPWAWIIHWVKNSLYLIFEYWLCLFDLLLCFTLKITKKKVKLKGRVIYGGVLVFYLVESYEILLLELHSLCYDLEIWNESMKAWVVFAYSYQ